MLSDKFAFTAIGALCVAAAGAGGYLAMRQAPVSAPAEAAAQASASTPVEMPTADGNAVEETEGVLTPSSDAAPSESATTASAAPESTQPPSRRAARREAAGPAPVPPAPAAPPPARERPRARAEKPPAPAAPRAPLADPPVAALPIVPEPEPIAASQPLAALPPDRFEPQPLPAPALPSYEDLVVSADSVIGLRTDTALSSERARVEDRVEARVVRDVRVGGQVAIPAGTRVLGSVTLVERGGRLRDRARLGIRFHTLAMSDGTLVPISTETIYRYGDAPGNASAAKIGGGAVAGAILGAILGGGKGAAIGATTGAAGGGAAVAAGDRSEARVPAGAEVTARILSPVTISIER